MAVTHTAGIIPVAQLQTDFKNIIHPVLTPIDNGYSFIQKSVYECAMAGCNTIWIVANDDIAPIIRHHVGEWVYDPMYYKRTYTKFYSEKRKEIPIYYVPVNPKHRDRYDSYGWSALYGCYMSWYASYKISKWLRPQNFFVSFPMSYYNINTLRDIRKNISSNNNMLVSHEGKTILDNKPASFTLKGEDFLRCRKEIREKGTRQYISPTESEIYPSKKLPLEERWSARHFKLSEVFNNLNIENSYLHEVDKFYDCRTWAEYRKMLSDEIDWDPPEFELTTAHQYAKIPYED